ncbi:MAG: cytochrome c oxidase subunit II [Deltaproteobacteria bacterium]
MEKLGGLFNPSSLEMDAMTDLTVYIIVISAAILGIIAFAVAYIIIRYRKKPGDDTEPYQDFGSLKLEIVWTAIPVAIVAVLFLLTCSTMNVIQPPVKDHEPDLVITGHQWWWEIYYPKSGVVTANELHIPLGKYLLIRLESIDVIHDFWVPELARKIDAVPGHPNYMWIEATKPGVYLGACAEFCGAQHANMRIRVIVENEEEFKEWEKQQLVIPATPRAGLAGEGAKLFQEKACMNCHTIMGTAAAANVGPNLTHLNKRQTIGAGVLTNSPENLAKWLTNPQKYKQGSLMPNMKLSDNDVQALVAYLEALK